MSDYEKLKTLLTEFKVGFDEENFDHEPSIVCADGDNRVEGYPGFYTRFQFNSDGSFREMGAYE